MTITHSMTHGRYYRVYLGVKERKMSKKILSKISYNIYKASNANTKIIYGIFPLYFEVALWYHIVHHITSHHITSPPLL